MPKITLLFAALHVLLMLALLVPISRHRHAHKIGLGDGGAGATDLGRGQRGVDQQHQAGFAQRARHRQPAGGAPGRAVEGLFKVDLGARTLVAGHAQGLDLGHDAVARPAGGQVLGAHVGVELVPRVANGFTAVLDCRVACGSSQ